MNNFKMPYNPLAKDEDYTNIIELNEFAVIGDLDDFIFCDEQSYVSDR